MYIFSTKFIEVNHYIHISFLDVSSVFLCKTSQGLFRTECNLVEPFSEYIVHLTPEPLLEFQHCFIILQAHFVFLEFYFPFDHNFFTSFALCSIHPSSVRYLYNLGLRVAISFIIFHPIRLSSTNYSFVFVYWYRSLDFTF